MSFYLDITPQEACKKYDLDLEVHPCPWCKGKTNAKVLRTKDSVCLNYECVSDDCDGWTAVCTPVTKEAREFWETIV